MSETLHTSEQVENNLQASADEIASIVPLASQNQESNIELEIANKEAKVKLIHKRIKLEVLALIIIIPIDVITVFTYVQRYIRERQGYSSEDALTDSFLFLGMLLFSLLIIFLIYDIVKKEINRETIRTEIDILKVKQRIESQFAKSFEQTSASYFDALVRINIDNLGEYYALVKLHTQKSFNASIIAGGVGFMLIICGIIISFLDITHTQTISYITTASGIITEFIASIFFYLYNKTVLQMKEYHDSLIMAQNILLAFKVIGDASNESDKIKMITQLLSSLLDQKGILVTPDSIPHS